ncbi:MAG TPA: glycosyltransferase family 4 protein [Actinoplanes sp.]|nr:glycosyltransferase family 4 protein [Actinoplanes sp.]
MVERVLSLATGWSGHGGHTFNRRLSLAMADVGYEVTARVLGETPSAQEHERLTVQGIERVLGIDDRGQMLRADNLPRNVDIILGHGRFTGGAASYLRDQFYPQAKVVHVVHALADELDRWRGDPQQATEHARTERLLIGKADLAVGVGPLLFDDAARMAQMNERPTAVHEMIPGVDIGPPPVWRDGQARVNLLLFGRVDDPLKGVEIASASVRLLSEKGYSVQLTALGANDRTLREQERDVSKEAGYPVKLKPFTSDRREIEAELRGADVVLMPSRAEGFGLVATEAAGLGVPVLVASSSGAGLFFNDPRRVPEHLGKPSVVPMIGTEPDLPQRWASRIEGILTDLPAARQRAADLRTHLGANYTWEHAARNLGEALDQVPRRQVTGSQQTRDLRQTRTGPVAERPAAALRRAVEERAAGRAPEPRHHDQVRPQPRPQSPTLG